MLNSPHETGQQLSGFKFDQNMSTFGWYFHVLYLQHAEMKFESITNLSPN